MGHDDVALAMTDTALDGRVVAAGALVTLAVAVPPALVVRIVRGSEVGTASGPWVVATLLAVFVAPVAGGAYAGTRRPRTALVHGAVAAGLGYVADAVLTVVRRAAFPPAGGTTSLVRLAPTFVLFLFLFVSLGLLGGYLAFRRSVAAS